jgi:hypothetical protein
LTGKILVETESICSLIRTVVVPWQEISRDAAGEAHMSFWDRVIFRMTLGLGEGHQPGFRTAALLLCRAHHNRQLPLASLNDLSLLLVLFVCPSDSAVHQAALGEFQRRNRSPLDCWEVLREALRPNLGDFHALAYHRAPRQRSLVESAYALLYVPALAIFLSRMALIELPEAAASARLRFHEVFPQIEPGVPSAHEPVSLDDGLLIGVYARELQAGRPIPSTWSVESPGWLATVPVEERRFLEFCWEALDYDLRCLLFLSFYAELNVRQITQILISAGDDHCSPEEVVANLDWIWRKVLDGLVVS